MTYSATQGLGPGSQGILLRPNPQQISVYSATSGMGITGNTERRTMTPNTQSGYGVMFVWGKST